MHCLFFDNYFCSMVSKTSYLAIKLLVILTDGRREHGSWLKEFCCIEVTQKNNTYILKVIQMLIGYAVWIQPVKLFTWQQSRASVTWDASTFLFPLCRKNRWDQSASSARPLSSPSPPGWQITVGKVAISQWILTNSSCDNLDLLNWRWAWDVQDKCLTRAGQGASRLKVFFSPSVRQSKEKPMLHTHCDFRAMPHMQRYATFFF